MSDNKGSYPGGKSGAGIYQRLINLIPQKNWREQLNRMSEQERLAMLEVLNTPCVSSQSACYRSHN